MAEITAEVRRANITHWKFQDRMMAEQGFPRVLRMRASRKPRAYEHIDGYWRISTARAHKWKLEHWTGRWYYPPAAPAVGLKIWAPVPKLFDTPLAVALWFHLVTVGGKPKEWMP